MHGATIKSNRKHFTKKKEKLKKLKTEHNDVRKNREDIA